MPTGIAACLDRCLSPHSSILDLWLPSVTNCHGVSLSLLSCGVNAYADAACAAGGYAAGKFSSAGASSCDLCGAGKRPSSHPCLSFLLPLPHFLFHPLPFSISLRVLQRQYARSRRSIGGVSADSSSGRQGGCMMILICACALPLLPDSLAASLPTASSALAASCSYCLRCQGCVSTVRER